MTAKTPPPILALRQISGSGRGEICDFLNQTSCSKPRVILPTDDGFYSLFTSFLSGGICKSVKEIFIPLPQLQSNLPPAPEEHQRSWLACVAGRGATPLTPVWKLISHLTCLTLGGSPKKPSLFQNVS